MSEAENPRQDIIRRLAANRWEAHRILFAARHPQLSCDAHRELVAHIYSVDPRLLLICFRGFGKTTYVEESIVLEAAFRGFKNRLIVGASHDRACERLEAIKRIFEQHELIEQTFGHLKGPIWQEDRIVLSNGVCIQALGRDQTMRGTKYLDTRPDSVVVDDIEDRQEALTPKGREKTRDWFASELQPGLDHPVTTPIKVLGTILHPESFVVWLAGQPGWRRIVVPVEHLDEDGNRRATWPGKFPLDAIDMIRADHARNMASFEREYMCNTAASSQDEFRPEMIRVVSREPSWHAVYAMYDPARTTRESSATTGKAVWSWIRNRIIVWEGGGERWMPDQIIDDIFDTVERYPNLVHVGVEEDGLNEFIRQPLRHEMLRRRTLIPFRPVHAPRGKLDFIRGLQPFFAAGEVEFARPMPELAAQLLSFPTGDIDAPNALAYALLLKPGSLVYGEFRDDHIAVGLGIEQWRPVWLAANAKDGIVTAILAQYVDGVLLILYDWVVEGTPDQRCADIQAEAQLLGPSSMWQQGARPKDLAAALKNPDVRPVIGKQPIRWVVPGWHYEKYLNVGLEQALRRIPAQHQRGGSELEGRAWLKERLNSGKVSVEVSENARWTLRAFTGGYALGVMKRTGFTSPEAESGPYKTLIEGLESFVATLALQPRERAMGEGGPNVSYDRRGRAYQSMMPARR